MQTSINNSRTAKEKADAQTKYTETNGQVKRSIKTDNSKYVEDLALAVEKATSTYSGKHGIQKTARMQLDDLDFIVDMDLLSYTQQQMQEKTANAEATSTAVHLNIDKG
ncbi:unnamed protein product [Schistosoma margrebowiei]|uniref:Uncharacterized protein n=1 Tax=Schistosoma margrebowiei TaxID=48269 RepID=A0A183N4X0_9TREM|nr:unnamed protein product [Schistosoma margrebowiei]